jgi:LysR family transcriptional regulator (chromosome initiation inhibitor)
VAAQRRGAGRSDWHPPPSWVGHFVDGVGARSLSRAPSLAFNAKDELQVEWTRRLCNRHVELPPHTVPSSQALVTATVAGMGWALHPQALIEPYLVNGSLVELVPHAPLDVPLYWQQARAASSLLDGLTLQLMAAAREALVPP